MSYFTTVKQGINKFLISRLRRRNKVKDNDLTIISNNCIAGVLYHDNDMKFNTPTINLFIREEDFVIFCENLDVFLNCKLTEERIESNYPVMSLNSGIEKIEIHFMHYKNYDEARDAWERRKLRINKRNMIIILCTSEATKHMESIKKFIRLPYKTFIISNCYLKNCNNQITLSSELYKKQFLYNGFTGKRNYEYYYDLKYILEKLKM